MVEVNKRRVCVRGEGAGVPKGEHAGQDSTVEENHVSMCDN